MLELCLITVLYVLGAVLQAALLDEILEGGALKARPVRMALCIMFWPVLIIMFCFLYALWMVRKNVS